MIDTFKAIVLDDIIADMSETDAALLMERIDKNVSYGDAAWTLVSARDFKSWLPEGCSVPALDTGDVFVAVAG